jgi:hypothetical protein
MSTNVGSLALALAAVALLVLALAFMIGGDFAVAGLAFLGTSVAIYLRETRI